MKAAERTALCRELAPLARSHDASLVVNDDSAAAGAAAAWGLHLPQGRDPQAARRALDSKLVIGVSTHSAEEIRTAEAAGADYLTLSPLFPSFSKPGYGPGLGIEAFSRLSAMARRPVIALGGIATANAALCREAGATGIAVLGSVMGAADPAHVFREIANAWHTSARSRRTLNRK